MALRSSWKGFIKLSLVSVPVKAFTAHATSQEIKLNQLHKACNTRVRYKKVCPEHGELAQDDIVSGYEYAKGQYVIIDVDELDKLRTENDRSIHIEGFLAPEKIDPIYYAGKSYYLTPDGPVGQKPYALLREGMLEKGKVAFAKVVISKRENIVLLRIIDEMLVMTIVHHKHLVKGAEAFKDEIEDTQLTKEELKLTNTLIDASTLEEFELGNYKEEYIEKLTALIQKKIDGEEVVQVADPEKPKIVNLMDALKQSVAAAQGMATEETEQKKMAPSTRKTSKKNGKKKVV